MYQTDLAIIAQQAEERESENDAFRLWLKNKDSNALDAVVHRINDKVSAAIDCTQCGNCCSKLVINVAQNDLARSSGYLHLSEEEFKEKYLEESQQGALFISTIPCHFFADKKCTIYEGRFKECRDFPHLHKPGFSSRLLGTLMHYGTCPIVYNVLEELKSELEFRY